MRCGLLRRPSRRLVRIRALRAALVAGLGRCSDGRAWAQLRAASYRPHSRRGLQRRGAQAQLQWRRLYVFVPCGGLSQQRVLHGMGALSAGRHRDAGPADAQQACMTSSRRRRTRDGAPCRVPAQGGRLKGTMTVDDHDDPSELFDNVDCFLLGPPLWKMNACTNSVAQGFMLRRP